MKAVYTCHNCGQDGLGWATHCPVCKNWGTLEREPEKREVHEMKKAKVESRSIIERRYNRETNTGTAIIAAHIEVETEVRGNMALFGGADADDFVRDLNGVLSKDETYNGWTNYETWLAYTWLTNDDDGGEAARISARMDSPEMAVSSLARVMTRNNVRAGLTIDLINAALDRVDWGSIVAALKE